MLARIPENAIGRYAHVDKLLRVNANGERPDVRVTTLELHAVGHRRQTQDTRARRQEMPGIVVRVEADEVTVQDTEQDLAPDRQNAIIRA